MSMIKTPVLTLAALSIAALASMTANAQQLSRTNLPYETYYTPEARNYLAPSLIPLKFDGRFEVWYLLGEPVINCTARWLNNHQLSVNTPGGDTIIAQKGDAEVYNLMLVAQLWDPERDKKNYGDKGGHIAAFCDAGIVAQSGQNGFNVAGSPNWDKFLCNLPSKFSKRAASPFAAEKKYEDLCEEVGGTWFSAEAAKKMARAGLKFEDVTIKSLEVNAGDAVRRYEKAQWRDKSFAYKESKANAIGQRLKQKDQFSTVAGTQVSQMRLKKGGQPATTALLKDYDSTLASLQNMLQDGGTFAAEWREKDQTLVREQLAHVRAIDDDLRGKDALLLAYQNDLTEKLNDLLDQGQFSLVDIKSYKDKDTGLWGYKFNEKAEWLIEPQFTWAATRFTNDGFADVILKDEFLASEFKNFRKSACGKSWTETALVERRRQQKAKVNYKGSFIEGPEWEEYTRGGPSYGITLCSG